MNNFSLCHFLPSSCSTLKIEATRSSEMSVGFQRPTRYCMTADRTRHEKRCSTWRNHPGNLSIPCMSSSRSQLLSPLFYRKEKRWDYDDSEYANLINFRVVKTIHTILFRDVWVVKTAELCVTLAMDIALQFYLCENTNTLFYYGKTVSFARRAHKMCILMVMKTMYVWVQRILNVKIEATLHTIKTVPDCPVQIFCTGTLVLIHIYTYINIQTVDQNTTNVTVNVVSLRRTPSSGMWRRVDLMWNDISE
jgi:hypothetical protein